MVFITALIFFIGYSILVQILKFAFSSPIGYPKLSQQPKGFTPNFSRDLYLDADELLKSLGCLGPVWFKLETETPPNTYYSDYYIGVYYHQEKQIYVDVTPSFDAGVPNTLKFTCLTPCKDGTWIHTSNNHYDLIDKTQEKDLEIIDTPDIKKLIKHHAKRCDAVSQEIDYAMPLKETVKTALDLQERLDQLVNEKVCIDVPQKSSYFFTFKIFPILIKILLAPKSVSAQDQDTPVDRMRLLYHAQQLDIEKQTLPTRFKIFFPLLSCVLFLIASHFIYDVASGAMLLFVIMFHEMGHYIAMVKCGYHNVDLAAVPLLGGVTTGIPRKFDQRQQAWIAIWGPLPGIILALIIGALAYFQLVPEFLEGIVLPLVLMLLIINYFNLLPILPLDGGHILINLIPNSFINVYRGVIILTAIVAVALVFLLDFPIFFLIFFLVPLFTMRNNARLLTIAREMRRVTHFPQMDDATKLTEVIERVKEKFPKTATRTQLAYIKKVYLTLSETSMKKSQRVVLLLVYCLLFAPVISVAGYYYKSIMNWSAEITNAQEAGIRALKDLDLLNPPITKDELAQFKWKFGQTMPEALQKIYRIANGSRDGEIQSSTQLIYAEDHPKWQTLMQQYKPMQYEYDDTGGEFATPIVIKPQQWLPIFIDNDYMILLFNITSTTDESWLTCYRSEEMYCNRDSDIFSTQYLFSYYYNSYLRAHDDSE